jgi:PIN domain nuclease of toxin-antitoxin system
VPYEDLFPGRLEAMGFEMLLMNPVHFRALLTMPWHHRDPFDRLLIAQAQIEGLTLVTRDPHFASYGVPILW